MYFSSALCIVLSVVASTLADKAKVDQLVNNITSSVASEVVQVYKANKDAKDVNVKLLDAAKVSLQKYGPQIKQVVELSGKPAEEVVKTLADKISDKGLKEAAAGGLQAPRLFGALALGFIQIVTDVVEMALTRY